MERDYKNWAWFEGKYESDWKRKNKEEDRFLVLALITLDILIWLVYVLPLCYKIF